MDVMADPKPSLPGPKADLVRIALLFGPILIAIGLLLISFGAARLHLAAQGPCTSFGRMTDAISTGNFKCQPL
jgi:hypothetical protein